jgi:hypothetical protein
MGLAVSVSARISFQSFMSSAAAWLWLDALGSLSPGAGAQAGSQARPEKGFALLLSKIRKLCYNNRVVDIEATRLGVGP